MTKPEILLLCENGNIKILKVLRVFWTVYQVTHLQYSNK